MAHTLSDDLATLLDLLAMLPPFQGDLDRSGGWDPRIAPPTFWLEFVRLSQGDVQAEPDGLVTYMASKIGPHVAKPPATASEAAHLASYTLQFFAVTTNRAACELLGQQFTPVFNMPDGDAALGRRWADEVVATAWRIYRSVGTPNASAVSLMPGRTILPTTRLT